jgi:hypothetical protein
LQSGQAQLLGTRKGNVSDVLGKLKCLGRVWPFRIMTVCGFVGFAQDWFFSHVLCLMNCSLAMHVSFVFLPGHGE